MHPKIHSDQKGMILVLAMFMLALLSMIGIASMMTSTTDIEIASGERQHVETFYRAQSAHIIAGELLLVGRWDRGLEGFETLDTDGNRVDMESISDYSFAFRVIDPDFMLEDEDSVLKTTPDGRLLKVWDAGDQSIDELPCPDGMGATECLALDSQIGSQDLGLWTDVRLVRRGASGQQITVADIDVDKIHSHYLAGGGAEFASKDLGVGSLSSVTVYNLDARARLAEGFFNKSPSRQALGFRVIN